MKEETTFKDIWKCPKCEAENNTNRRLSSVGLKKNSKCSSCLKIVSFEISAPEGKTVEPLVENPEVADPEETKIESKTKPKKK